MSLVFSSRLRCRRLPKRGFGGAPLGLQGHVARWRYSSGRTRLKVNLRSMSDKWCHSAELIAPSSPSKLISRRLQKEAPPAPADLKCLHALHSQRILYYCRHTIWSAATCIVLILRRYVSQRAEQSPKDLHYPTVFDRYSCVCTK